jgi:hypothetical protein
MEPGEVESQMLALDRSEAKMDEGTKVIWVGTGALGKAPGKA